MLPSSSVDGPNDVPRHPGSVTRNQASLNGDGLNWQLHRNSRQLVRHSENVQAHKCQHLLVPDPVAFRYLQDDTSVSVVNEKIELSGYELYFVEQWACSRAHPSFLITTFTGLSHHKVNYGAIAVPWDESQWSDRLKVFIKFLSTPHARRKETSQGTIIVTNLSSLPSALTVIPLSSGDVKGSRELFIINEDMKRLGCSGRAGLSLGQPSAATEAKFLQLYRTHENVPVAEAVVELVCLCQVALVLFEKLDCEIVDGLLCDQTERAITDWWTEIGMEYFTVEPQDGILGPTTVAALLGLLLGARNRLHAYGAPVSKDAFDIRALKRGISYFQRAQRLPKSRRLDSRTLDRLHRTTSKAAKNEGWAVPRAVRSTVAEFGGKGGEMVMGMVGGRDKAGIAEVETLDLGVLIEFLYGERCRWLWHGRSRKTHTPDILGSKSSNEIAATVEARPNSPVLGRQHDSPPDHLSVEQLSIPQNLSYVQTGSPHSSPSSENEESLHRTVLKTVTGRMSDAKSGLGRFKDAVGLQGRREKQSRHPPALHKPVSKHHHNPETRIENSLTSSMVKGTGSAGYHLKTRVGSRDRNDESTLLASRTGSHGKNAPSPPDKRSNEDPGVTIKNVQFDTSSNTYDFGGKTTLSDINKEQPQSLSALQQSSRLSRSRSMPAHHFKDFRQSSEFLADRMSRRMSYRIVEDALRGYGLTRKDTVDAQSGKLTTLGTEKSRSLDYELMENDIHELESRQLIMSDESLTHVEEMANRAINDLSEMKAMKEQKLEELRDLNSVVLDLSHEEKSSATNEFKDSEVLGAKLEYELNALVSKVEDVEDGIADFERQVLSLEDRIRELQVADKVSTRNSLAPN